MREREGLSPRWLLAVAAGVGMLATSQAMLWARVLGGANHQRPDTVAHTLGCFFSGLALGALTGRALQARLGFGTLRFFAFMMAMSGSVFYLAMPVGAAALGVNETMGRLILFAAVAVTAAGAGAVVPLLCAAVESVAVGAGRATAQVLCAVALGAAAAPVATGYVLLDVETLEHTILVVAVAGLGVSQALWLAAPERHRRAGVTVFALGALAALGAHQALFASFLPKLHFGERHGEHRGYQHVAQGRSGIVGVLPDGREFGDGMYEGTFNLDPAVAASGIRRALVVPALHRTPRRVLEIGLGTGAWARTLAGDPVTDSLTIIELNPAHVDVLWHHSDIADVLDDPRVRLHFDDGRRWLARHPARRFDVIVVNGAWHWQSGATHLLSAEFLRVLQGHLTPDGMVYLNTTGSLDVLYTAAGVFRHVVRVGGFVAAGDAPFDQSPEERRVAMRRVRASDGEPRIRGGEADALLDTLLSAVSSELAPDLRRANDLWNITDDNMATEFKTNGAGKWWRALPGRVWRPDRAWPTVLF